LGIPERRLDQPAVISQGDRFGGYSTMARRTKYAGGANLNTRACSGPATMSPSCRHRWRLCQWRGHPADHGWAFGLAFEHWITPQLDSWCTQQGEFRYNNAVIAGRLFCGGSGAAVQTS